ncbi:QRFP-like peptide receptor [Octopus sinensis]|nr:QRFP-like peptide receptor [Octopus sinensis]XP_036366474.1 QRFP-like peptide receptor [Octopus sinensis]
MLSVLEIYESLPSWPFLMLFILYICVAVTGNVAVIIVVASRKYMRTPANLYISSLSFADLIIALVVIGNTAKSFSKIYLEYSIYRCVLVPYFEVVAISASVLSLMAITVDRYQAVLQKRVSKTPLKFAAKIVGLVWLSAVIYGLRVIPQFYSKLKISDDTEHQNRSSTNPPSKENNLRDESSDHNGNTSGIHRWSCDFFMEEDETDMVFRFFDFLILFVVPFIAMIVMYGRIISTLWRKKIPVGTGLRRKRRVAKMLLISVLVFMICWVPFYVQEFVGDGMIMTGKHVDRNVLAAFRIIFILVSFANCCLNPVIYAYYNNNFRYELKYMIRQKNKDQRHKHTFQVTPTSSRNGI